MQGKVLTTDAQIDQALARAANRAPEPLIVRVEYFPEAPMDLFMLHFDNGTREVIPRERLQGLQNASVEELKDIELLGGGTGVWWPRLDRGHYVPSLLDHQYGNRNWMAELGRRGGASTSPAKTKAARANGQRGGRPKQPNPESAAA